MFFFILIFIIFLFFLGNKWFKSYCNYITYKRLDYLFPKKNIWEKDLDIYSISMPIFYNSFPKKQKCVLLISGFRDIPYLWNNFIKHLIEDRIDYYAPRTFGNGRSFFQDNDVKDWILTYLEAIYILQELYEEIEIISFSAGTVIALYLIQFEYKCKINNLFLCAPYLLPKKSLTFYLFYESYLSWIINPLYKYTLNYHFKDKSSENYKTCRNIIYEKNSLSDYYELVGNLHFENKLINFLNIKLQKLYVNNIVILNPNDDHVIGDIYEQQKIVEKIFFSKIDLITIPSINIEEQNLCGHVMFKEHPSIVKNIYDNISKYF